MADAAQDGFARRAQGLEREAREQGDEQGLQHLALGEGRHEGGGDDAEQEVRGGLAVPRLRLTRGAGRLGEVEAGAGLQDVADDQADGQGDGRHHQEVAEGQTADGADLGGLAYGADPQHDRAEDDRRDHHLDEVDEAGSDRLELDGGVRRDEAHQDAEPHRRDDGEIQIFRTVPLGGGHSHGGLLGSVLSLPRPWGPR